ncbi:YbaN family protein [Amphibacillus jilinensis]|uniref:YbaN family protein n=1 Tax=Amphibacillus jilinensis TaxID=1216008 RepID=UPI00037A3DF4|nr:YbaN family protein [Amphibacillus jilinensis]
MNFNYFKRILFIILGSICLILGTIGIFLPILPTTPLLLLTAFLYVRSSNRLYNWLIHHPVFGAFIYCYVKYKAVPLKTKCCAIIILWPSILFSIYLISNQVFGVMLIVIASIVTFYIATLKTLPKEEIIEVKKLHKMYREKKIDTKIS